MRLDEVSYGDGVPIDAYGPAGFRIDAVLHAGPVFLRPGGPVPWGGYADADTLLSAAETIDVLIIGTGPEIAPIPQELRQRLEDNAIGVEIMATGPACRTYNVLLGEGRRIGVALLPL